MRILISKTPLDTIYNKFNQVLPYKCQICGQYEATHLVTYDSDVYDKHQTVLACVRHFNK